MSTSYTQRNNRFNKKLLAMVITGFLAAPAMAQDSQQSIQTEQPQQNGSSQTTTNMQSPKFGELDQDRDDALVWREIYVVMDPRIVAANLDQEQIFDEYDSDGDDALNSQEFDDFLNGLEQREIASGETRMRSDSQDRQAISNRGSAEGGSQQRNGQQTDQLANSESAHGADQAVVMPEDSRYNSGGGAASTNTSTRGQAGNQEQSGDADLVSQTEYLTDGSEGDNSRALSSQSNQRDQPASGDRRPGDNTTASASGEYQPQSQQSEDAEYLSGNSPTVDDPGNSMNTDGTRRDQFASGDQRPGDNTSASSGQNANQQASQRESDNSDAVSNAEYSREYPDQNLYEEYSTVGREGADDATNTQAATIESGSAYEQESNRGESSGLSTAGTNGSSASQDQPQALQNASISSLQKKTVTNSAGEELGKVRDVVVNRERGEVGFVVSSGGVLGIGSKKILAPADELSLQQENLVWDTDKSTKELRESAKYRSDGYDEISDENQTIEEARQAGL